VEVRNGAIIEEYTSDIIQMVRLFSELVRLGQSQFLDNRDAAWEWILKYPLHTQVWKGYFEDIHLDPHNQNRDQLSCLETARFILQHPEFDPDWKVHVPTIIKWVHDALDAQPFYSTVPIHEQKFCFHVMGSHTVRYASLCAAWAKASGEAEYQERAIRSFNWATYMANEDGTVNVGIDRPDYYNQCWFTDGYFDNLPHFLDGMAAIPGLAPSSTDHLLSSTSIVRDIQYGSLSVSYPIFDEQASEILRLTFLPTQVRSGAEILPEIQESGNGPGWKQDESSGAVRVMHTASDVEITGK
jgi:hypothetical protein